MILVFGVALLVAVLLSKLRRLRGEGSWRSPSRAGARPERGC